MLLLGVVQAQAFETAAAGSYDLLATEILTGSEASITFSSLGDYAADYQHLQLRFTARNSASNEATILVDFNSDTTNSYAGHRLYSNSGAVASDSFINRANLLAGYTVGTDSVANAFSGGVIDILDPFETTKNTTTRTLTGGASGNVPRIFFHSGAYFKTDSINAIKLADSAGNFIAGSRFSLYGIKAV
jgi:hypothetical protein